MPESPYQLIAEGTVQRVVNRYANAVRQLASGMDMEELSDPGLDDLFLNALHDMAKSGLDTIAMSGVRQAFNAGRSDEFKEAEDDDPRVAAATWRFSALLDKSTCDPCEARDGQEAPDGPDTDVTEDCEGKDLCRCMVYCDLAEVAPAPEEAEGPAAPTETAPSEEQEEGDEGELSSVRLRAHFADASLSKGWVDIGIGHAVWIGPGPKPELTPAPVPAASGEGHWVTINGAHVYIGSNGTIEKGPAHMLGKKPDDLTPGSVSPRQPTKAEVIRFFQGLENEPLAAQVKAAASLERAGVDSRLLTFPVRTEQTDLSSAARLNPTLQAAVDNYAGRFGLKPEDLHYQVGGLYDPHSNTIKLQSATDGDNYRHEWGHQLDDKWFGAFGHQGSAAIGINAEGKRDYANMTREYETSLKMVRDANWDSHTGRNYDAYVKAVRNSPSTYALENRSEWFAESFRVQTGTAKDRARLEKYCPASSRFMNNFVTGRYFTGA
jgi:hypothetical protein